MVTANKYAPFHDAEWVQLTERYAAALETIERLHQAQQASWDLDDLATAERYAAVLETIEIRQDSCDLDDLADAERYAAALTTIDQLEQDRAEA